MDAEFLIAGGGLGGGVLAALLARAGRSVIVLEQNPHGTPLVRPEVLWPATIEVVSSLLTPEEMRDCVVPVEGLRIFRGEHKIGEIAPETIASSGVQPHSTDPSATRAKLLESGKFEVRRGVEAIGVLKEGARITGLKARETVTQREMDLTAAWVIGDDGAHSLVRGACGIELQTRLFPVEFFCFGFDWPRSLPAGWPHAFLNPHSVRSCLPGAGGLPLPNGKGAGLVLANGKRLAATADATADWQQFLESSPHIAEITAGTVFPRDFVHVKRPWGHAAHYGAEGAVLLGDAIHPVSPAGGQGANMSVQDARVLAEILLSGHRQPVAEYERRRRRANDRSMNITRRAADFFEGRGIAKPAAAFPGLVRTLLKMPMIQRRVLRFIARAFQE